MLNAVELVGASRRELAGYAARGHRVDPRSLDDTIYDGISLGLPAVIERLTWTKFGKVFHRDPSTGRLRGWNMKIEQDELDRPWRPMRRDGGPITFGHFAVDEVGETVVLDYGKGGNRMLDPISVLRDPLVALDGPRVLLGWSDVAIGPLRLPTPSYFVLTRGGPLGAPVRAPRRGA